MGIVKFKDPSRPNVVGNLLPNHSDKGVNAITESRGRRIKADEAKVKTPLKWVWKQMIDRGLITQDSEEKPRGVKKYCEFHVKESHDIQECTEFRTTAQNLMDNKEMEFYEKIKGSEEWEDSKRVSWNYDCNVTIPGEENLVKALEEGQNMGFYTHSGKRYDPAKSRAEPVKGKALAIEQEKEKTVRVESPINEPVTKKEAREFLKFLKHSNALVKLLNETYVTGDIPVNKLDHLVNNISADNFLVFNDDEILPGGMRSTKALHITIHCKGYTLPGVLTDNGSALNVPPLSIVNRLPVDSSHMKTCQNIVRAFDGTKRKVIGKIEIPLLIGPSTYEVDFLVMDIKPSYNCLLGRPWIHSAGAVPSSLHQKLKLVIESRLVTINTKEDIIAFVTSDAPYVGIDDEAIEYSFQSLEFVSATFIVEGNNIPMPKISKTTRIGLQLMVGKRALPGRGLEKCLKGRVETPMLTDKQDHFGLGYKPDTR
ncbi:uncharacterized protein [Gossypium hirsutum]|uniref:Gag-pro-like protein n=1 Tax=Gossypium hirsutum TaxID=3635 RepID=A0A1U8IAR5_GOSHI|nr:uncharacterized protein LOC107894573 [Gossypium hirsutum]